MEKTIVVLKDIEVYTTITFRNYDSITSLYTKNAQWEIGQVQFIIEVLKLLVVKSEDKTRLDNLYDQEVNMEEMEGLVEVITKIMWQLIDSKKKATK